MLSYVLTSASLTAATCALSKRHGLGSTLENPVTNDVLLGLLHEHPQKQTDESVIMHA